MPDDKKKPRGRSFTGVDDPRNRQNVVPPAPLTDVPDETDLMAMEALWFQKGKAKTLRQEAWVRLYKESAKAFLDRKDRIMGRSPESPGESSELSDSKAGGTHLGSGPCPRCGWPAEEKGPEFMQEEWDVMSRFSRHMARVIEFLDREGLA